MTPACNFLAKAKIAYTLHEYEHDPAAASFGLEAAEKLGLAVHTVYKTLLITDEAQFYVAVIPVDHTLNLKKAAQGFKTKKVRMAKPDEAERITGYLVGGISPIAQKKRLRTLIDACGEALDQIYVSGGKRGLDIGLAPRDLITATGAAFCDLVNTD